MRDSVKFLDENNIEYTLYEHKPVHTVAESEVICKDIPGVRCKNLFITADGQFWLVVMVAQARLDMKALAKHLGVKKVRFASPEQLWEFLKITPGSVSPLCLLNDVKNKVKVIIDSRVWNAQMVGFHPNDNSATLVTTTDGFHTLIRRLKTDFSILDL